MREVEPTPLEERWEAIDTCERLFRDNRRRVSTGQIGLARLSEGLELVRIGEPQRPEFAAWRYGDQFGRRRRRILMSAAAGTVGVGMVLADPILGGAGSGAYLAWNAPRPGFGGVAEAATRGVVADSGRSRCRRPVS